MKIVDRSKKKFVKILIGTCETGDTNISKPIMSISIEDTNVDETYEMIMDTIKKREEESEEIISKQKRKL